jgi:hypothetical protein
VRSGPQNGEKMGSTRSQQHSDSHLVLACLSEEDHKHKCTYACFSFLPLRMIHEAASDKHRKRSDTAESAVDFSLLLPIHPPSLTEAYRYSTLFSLLATAKETTVPEYPFFPTPN